MKFKSIINIPAKPKIYVYLTPEAEVVLHLNSEITAFGLIYNYTKNDDTIFGFKLNDGVFLPCYSNSLNIGALSVETVYYAHLISTNANELYTTTAERYIELLSILLNIHNITDKNIINTRIYKLLRQHKRNTVDPMHIHLLSDILFYVPVQIFMSVFNGYDIQQLFIDEIKNTNDLKYGILMSTTRSIFYNNLYKLIKDEDLYASAVNDITDKYLRLHSASFIIDTVPVRLLNNKLAEIGPKDIYKVGFDVTTNTFLYDYYKYIPSANSNAHILCTRISKECLVVYTKETINAFS